MGCPWGPAKARCGGLMAAKNGWDIMCPGAPGNNPNVGGSNGLADSLSFSISASWSRFALARRFWNQIFTWVSVSRSELENSARSAMLRYCLSRNFFSRARSCCVVKGVRGFRFGLCFRRAHRTTGC